MRHWFTIGDSLWSFKEVLQILLRSGDMSVCAVFQPSYCNKNLKIHGLVVTWYRKEPSLESLLRSNFRTHACFWLNPAIFEWLSVIISIMIFISDPICHLLKQVVYRTLWGTEGRLELNSGPHHLTVWPSLGHIVSDLPASSVKLWCPLSYWAGCIKYLTVGDIQQILNFMCPELDFLKVPSHSTDGQLTREKTV